MNLFFRIWNASPGSIARGIRRRWEDRDLKPGWHSVKEGVLAGAELCLPQSGPVWKEMIAGHYDEFFYQALPFKPAGKRVWDIGAHVGYHSLAFASLGAEVLAFEPNPANLERLAINLKRNQKLAAHIRQMPVAVSDQDGEAAFCQSPDLRGASLGGHLERALPPLSEVDYKEAHFKKTMVPTMRIDTLAEKHGELPPDIIKIDVEGAEELVLRGGVNLLTKQHPVLLIEVHHICLMFSIQEMLLALGYKVRLLDEQHSSPSRCFIIAQAGRHS